MTRCCEASGAGGATGGCSRNRLASPVTCRSRRFESKAHGALHGHSTKLAKERQPSRWSAQRTRHTKWVGEERAPRNAASGRVAALPPGTRRPTPCGCIESRSRFLEVSIAHQPFKLSRSSTLMVFRLRNNTTRIAKPMAASAAATVIIKNTKTCPAVSFK